jgi:hypothetical protein
LFFSLYMALLVVWFREAPRDCSVFLETLERPLWFLNDLLGRPLDFSNTFYGISNSADAAAGLLAVIVFACLRAAGWTRVTSAAIRYGVGLVAVAGPLYSPCFAGDAWCEAAVGWTRIEVAIVAAYAVLYLHARWAARWGLAAVVLALHAGFWAFIWSGGLHRYIWQWSLLLALPVDALLCWGYDVRQSRALPSSTAPTPTSGG